MFLVVLVIRAQKRYDWQYKEILLLANPIYWPDRYTEAITHKSHAYCRALLMLEKIRKGSQFRLVKKSQILKKMYYSFFSIAAIVTYYCFSFNNNSAVSASFQIWIEHAVFPIGLLSVFVQKHCNEWCSFFFSTLRQTSCVVLFSFQFV